jgi:hypothetical protein
VVQQRRLEPFAQLAPGCFVVQQAARLQVTVRVDVRS